MSDAKPRGEPARAGTTPGFFATAARNLETLLAEELRAMGIADAKETRAGVRFGGGLADAYRVLVWSRVASRVLLPLAEFDAPDAEHLYAAVQDIHWPDHLAPGRTLAVHLDAVRSGIDNGHYGALKVKDAIVDQFRALGLPRPDVDTARPDVALRCHIFRDHATLSLDLAGDPLHRRGWRAREGAAPLKESLATAVLLRAGWPEIAAEGGGLLDPLCGAGTLPIEAALMAADIAPGLLRSELGVHWGCTGWAGHDAAAWAELLAEARARRAAGLTAAGRTALGRRGLGIRGSDQDPQAVRAAQANAARAGLGGHLHFERRALGDCVPAAGEPPGLLVTNPPYGERLGADSELPALYAALGAVLRERFDGWRAAVLTGNPDLGKVMGLRAARFHTLYNGPIECRLLHFRVRPEAHVSDRPRPLPAAERGPGAQMLANRLRKNQKALAKWLRAKGISCWRLYDADLPEYALAVDIYTSAEPETPERRFVHVQEYAPPADVDPRAARRRLREAMGVIAEVLAVPEQDLFFKVRQRQRGAAQYERQGHVGEFHRVTEDGLQLLVNFADYLDTGLFLDHRDTRRLVRERSRDRHVLNLFCYTASASVHAAAGGARSTTGVDLSRTYVDWARRNLALNGFTGRDHQLIQADCLTWLANARAYRGRFGLIFLDPPTFSSSKRMQGTFDVQRDHVGLLRAAIELLAPDGELIFSTNRRRFRLDSDALAAHGGLQIGDISDATIPRDFRRNPHIHRCWRLRRQG
ncbi:23S rRNA (guanine(2445)-N(2))/(guanine(2069)-N(7))-methyltransferase [Thiohalocapsa halophila]|uniref:Ribosomal RNA large subunit methyltransferase K/L n=1 Tax=Thiohalocapsa halophila TaxID=69359 RepID=A0ABS1CPB8_9GAMM|nr:bifunctional 23S rRNA (guanine(2069)-N(7))-methyltransferase RlmK/23S rRNA (guanine(2445)-N(2))-methyltransferase RlmL [Thiohalocapsa halophila]MBK1633668.1 23S rRNA (guanine(2445)-N(2))/(guanine(2069)-N(7))-methyltransferase [Thiohalocapsa halophila]